MKNKNTDKQLFFFSLEKNKNYFRKLSLLPFILLVIGIFLLPNFAFATEINPENIINLTNEERNKLNIKPLTANQLLTKAAYTKANDLFEHQVFEHNIEGKIFSSWVREAGYDYNYVGENLALDFVTAEGAIRAWMESPTHKKNITNNRFEETGVAVVEGNFDGKSSILIVQIFGTKMKDLTSTTILQTISKNNTSKQNSYLEEIYLDFSSSVTVIFYINSIFFILINLIFVNVYFNQNKKRAVIL